MLFCRLFLFCALLGFSLTIPAIFKRLTHSFHSSCLLNESLVLSESQPLSHISDSELHRILNQDFYYLGRGAQNYAYVSQDEKYVLKLFICERRDALFYRWIGLPEKENVYDRTLKTLNATLLANNQLFNETALLHANLKLDKSDNPISVHLIGPAWHRTIIDLNGYYFVLQKRATLLKDAFLETIERNDHAHFENMLGSFVHLLETRSKLWIRNEDQSLLTNFGFIDGVAIEIDFGCYVECKESFWPNNDKQRYITYLAQWIGQNKPEWVKDVEKFLN